MSRQKIYSKFYKVIISQHIVSGGILYPEVNVFQVIGKVPEIVVPHAVTFKIIRYVRLFAHVFFWKLDRKDETLYWINH